MNDHNVIGVQGGASSLEAWTPSDEDVADLRDQVEAARKLSSRPPRPSARVKRRRRENAEAVVRRARRKHVRDQRRKNR